MSRRQLYCSQLHMLYCEYNCKVMVCNDYTGGAACDQITSIATFSVRRGICNISAAWRHHVSCCVFIEFQTPHSRHIACRVLVRNAVEDGPTVTFRSMAGKHPCVWKMASWPSDNNITVKLTRKLYILADVVAVNVKYIWPLQAPLADGGAQRKRLNAVRQQLGWQIIGCDYIECFQ